MTSAFVVLAAALSYAAEPSGALPLLHIDTENGAAITSKEDYVNASLYLDANGVSGVEPVGSADAPVSLKIKGRGNYTWTGFDKKPYRLKFDKKVSILGMKKNKHFGLLAHADDNLGFLRNAVGFELSRKLGLAWTPTAEPVEVLLNGEYIGLYFLTELIRVDPDRVDIVEQADNATDAEAVTGGWLVEIDNYDTDPHIEITEGNGERIIFTYKTPEILSSVQGSYLTSQMTAINAAIYTSDKSSTEWEKYVDIDALARYYVVQEILDDCESFHGSCYMHKQLGNDTNEALCSISGTDRHSTKHGLAKSTNSRASKPRSKKYGASFAPSITPIPNAISAHLPIRSRLRHRPTPHNGRTTATATNRLRQIRSSPNLYPRPNGSDNNGNTNRRVIGPTIRCICAAISTAGACPTR